MAGDEAALDPVAVSVENVGGITETTVECSPGVTVLAGRNATNRTSLLTALRAALGSDDVALKGDADEGRVDLRLNGQSISRRLVRRGDDVVVSGPTLADDHELAERFAFLLESNAARRAVERGDDLYEVIMGPVDTADIEARIDDLEDERARLEAALDDIDRRREELPDLEERRSALQAELEERREALAARREELEALRADTGLPGELEARLAERREARAELEGLRDRLEDERRVVEALEDDRADVEAELEGLATVDDDERAAVEERLRRRRTAVQDVESSLADLQSVVQFNESLLEEGLPGGLGELPGGDGSPGSVTDRLVEDGPLVCWTCGSEVERDAVERTLEHLRERHSELIDRRRELREELEELEAERKHLERTVERERELRERLGSLERDLTDRRRRVDDLEDEAAEVEASLEALDAAVADLETDEQAELLATHREVNELEFELDRRRDELDTVEEEIAAVESRLEERERLEASREELEAELDDLRSRIERLEREAVEAFNGEMEAVLDLLEYENLERVWIERVEREAAGRGGDRRTAFDLHVVRATASGAVYEDTVDHLSESEREVVGLVFALAGYLVHDVHEQVPFLLLDSLEAFDAERVASLVDHFAGYADYLVVALLPEDAAALDEGYRRVTTI